MRAISAAFDDFERDGMMSLIVVSRECNAAPSSEVPAWCGAEKDAAGGADCV
jgi:hypothetical protein